MLGEPYKLPCGVILPNRIVKSAMTESLADELNLATDGHSNLYRTWSEGGAGLLISGNIMVDRRYLEKVGNIVIDGHRGLGELRSLAQAGTSAGNHFWAQLSHPGRQTPANVCAEPVAPSSVSINGYTKEVFNSPRVITTDEIWETIGRFAIAAEVCRDAGFTGVQLHSAHGYLLSSFLSPHVNLRTDEWGGSLVNRTRLLREIYKEVRKRVGADFPISVKMNSSDFQKGGLGHDESVEVVKELAEMGFDLVELSGGSYEDPVLFNGVEDTVQLPVKESTQQREAYFLVFAEAVREIVDVPLVVTGGFRSREGMVRALESGALDFIGLARPLCSQPNAPKLLIDGSVTALDNWSRQFVALTAEDLDTTDEIVIRQTNLFGDLSFHYLLILDLAANKQPNTERLPLDALMEYLEIERNKISAWENSNLNSG